jgi:hypothetical protein
MIDTKLHDQLDDFLSHAETNAWLVGDYLRVYLRKTQRWVNGPFPEDAEVWKQGRVACIDVANISDMHISFQLEGIFPAFLDHLENQHHAIYVENVIPPQLRWYFDRRGYMRVPDVREVSFCKPSELNQSG